MRAEKQTANSCFEEIKEIYMKQQFPSSSSEWPDIVMAVEWIKRNIWQPGCTVFHLTGECGITQNDFRIRFKLTTGKSPLQYIRSHRIELAKKVLSDPDFIRLGGTIGELGFLVGYNSLSAFSKAFKVHEGVSPREYLEQQAL
jgi:AraC-like DNA-binding protein